MTTLLFGLLQCLQQQTRRAVRSIFIVRAVNLGIATP
jgi:hypothetical protein